MIIVRIEHAAVDEPGIHEYPDFYAWEIDKSGVLTVGEPIVTDYYSGIPMPEVSYAPGAWRTVERVDE